MQHIRLFLNSNFNLIHRCIITERLGPSLESLRVGKPGLSASSALFIGIQAVSCVWWQILICVL